MGDAIITGAAGCVLAVWAMMRILAGERQRRMDELAWRLEKEAREAEEDGRAARTSERGGKPRQGGRMAA